MALCEKFFRYPTHQIWSSPWKARRAQMESCTHPVLVQFYRVQLHFFVDGFQFYTISCLPHWPVALRPCPNLTPLLISLKPAANKCHSLASRDQFTTKAPRHFCLLCCVLSGRLSRLTTAHETWRHSKHSGNVYTVHLNGTSWSNHFRLPLAFVEWKSRFCRGSSVDNCGPTAASGAGWQMASHSRLFRVCVRVSLQFPESQAPCVCHQPPDPSTIVCEFQKVEHMEHSQRAKNGSIMVFARTDSTERCGARRICLYWEF